ncbi:MAG: hypothetical protein ACR2FV_02025, partial [Ornithinimicrobium sp.]
MAAVTGWGEPTGHGEAGHAEQAGAVEARWAPVTRAIGVLAESVQQTVRCTEAEIASGLAVLDRAHAQAQRCVLAMLVEGHSRGLHLDTGLSVHDWVAARCPGLTRAAVSDLAAVVKA